MASWKATIRKENNTARAINMDEERRQDPDIGQMTSILSNTNFLNDFDALRSKRRLLTTEELRLATEMVTTEVRA